MVVQVPPHSASWICSSRATIAARHTSTRLPLPSNLSTNAACRLSSTVRTVPTEPTDVKCTLKSHISMKHHKILGLWTFLFFCSLAPDGRAGTSLLSFLDMQFPCHQCGKAYKHKTSLTKHRKYECGMEAQFQCPRCPYRAKQKASLKSHIFMRHQQIPDL